jgi:choline dehydrogenase-like flavoprotein
VAHQNGTARFGQDPKHVLDTNCKAHDLEDLYIVDRQPSPPVAPRTETIMANALRVGDHLLERLG